MPSQKTLSEELYCPTCRRLVPGVVSEARHEQMLGKLQKFADSVERDRREPDKLLCHVQSARRLLR